MDFPSYLIQIFAKAPIPGQVKTRMQPVLNLDQCAILHRELTLQVCNEVVTSDFCPVEVWAACEPHHVFFNELNERFGLPIKSQLGESLGSRMENSAEQALRKYDGVIIVGADCPFVDKLYLQQALQQLRQGVDAVIGPAVDGGYVLLGLGRVHPALFSEITWGTELVLEQTIERLRFLRYSFKLLPPQIDIDRPEDLKFLEDRRISQELREFSQFSIS